MRKKATSKVVFDQTCVQNRDFKTRKAAQYLVDLLHFRTKINSDQIERPHK